MITDSNVLIFKAIVNFVTELANIYKCNQISLALYSRLLDKTTISHEIPIIKHINAFTSFCKDNRTCIINKNIDLVSPHIRYSKKVYIDMTEIFKLSDNDTRDVIWNHILTISALVDPVGKAKKILRENISKTNTKYQNDVTHTEAEFLSNIIDKVEKNVDPNADPISAVTNIMNSGIFTDLIGGMQKGMQDGSLDISKLMSAVQGMISHLSSDMKNVECDSEIDNGMNKGINMLQCIMGNTLTKNDKLSLSSLPALKENGEQQEDEEER